MIDIAIVEFFLCFGVFLIVALIIKSVLFVLKWNVSKVLESVLVFGLPAVIAGMISAKWSHSLMTYLS